jgi:ribosomal protein L21
MGLNPNSTSDYYGIYKRGKTYFNSQNKREVLGYEAIYQGEGSLERKGEPATIYVEKSISEILKGERVIAIHRDKIVDVNFIPKVSTINRDSIIVGVLTNGAQHGVKSVGALDVVIIDAGLDDGIEVGDVLNIHKRGLTVTDPIVKNSRVKLPDEKSGHLMVFRAFNRLSYALVMDAQTTLRIGDIAKSPLVSD